MKKRPNAWILAAFVLYLCALLRLTVLRDGCFSHALFTGRVSLVPAQGYIDLWRWRSYPTFFYLLLGNIAWFIPLGAYARYRGGRLCGALLAGLLLSLCIEGGQFLLGTGLAETDDIVLNTLGAGLGYALLAAYQRLCARKRRETHAAGQ